MDAVERLKKGWDDCVATNRALNEDLARAETLLRLAQEAGVIPDVWEKIEAFLNRGW